ncbi:NADH-quinone oxidoreductase subunit C [Marinilongibacter aquaticus]|uniref:NADH-quinone oxidoreductase subunit C n=1 Tax=Marinilongibacter aquaticus TaxID=2975157 RepID=UPI0021BDE8F7|nr:NADH-quinone oxidoreductase subunit C [Marinilongibacter aquaticus]UBM60336.1 NADH-quinone oxidoreductase subunit C [Marinilongibacter aquaticus]
MISNQEIVEDLAAHFGENVLEFEEPNGLLTFTTYPSALIDVMTYLRDNDRLRFKFLTDVTAVHYPDSEGKEFCSVYHMHSFENGIRLRIKVFVSKEKPEVPTATGIFAAANWMEREAYDFYGVIYTGHPNLKRILNMEDMDYHPLRKEYPLEDATREDKIDALFGR